MAPPVWELELREVGSFPSHSARGSQGGPQASNAPLTLLSVLLFPL